MSHYPTGDPEAKVTTRLLRSQLGEDLLEANDFRGDLTIRIQPARLIEALTLLKNQPELSFDMLLDVCGADWPEREPRFDLVYHLLSLKHGRRLRLKVAVPADDPVAPSATGIWSAAEWFEREAWDMFGIRFEGHPDLRRLLCHEQFVGHPLRKDYEQTKRHRCTEVSNLE
jgi:NADH/F420H2 dehydrogenase subunit C